MRRRLRRLLGRLLPPLALAACAEASAIDPELGEVSEEPALSDAPVPDLVLSPAAAGAPIPHSTLAFQEGIPLHVLERVAERWSLATGLDVVASREGGALVGLAEPGADPYTDCRTPQQLAEGKERQRATACSVISETDGVVRREAIHVGPVASRPCDLDRTLLHEVGHLLQGWRPSNGGHVEQLGRLMSYGHVVDDSCFPIDAESLVKVCETAPCTKFAPEAELSER